MNADRTALQKNEKARGIKMGFDGNFDEVSFERWFLTTFDGAEHPLAKELIHDIVHYGNTHFAVKDKLAKFLRDLLGIELVESARFCINEILTPETIKLLNEKYYNIDWQECDNWTVTKKIA